MPGWAKVLIAIGVAGMVVVVALIVAAVLWFRSNADELQARGEVARAEGRQFGSGSTAAGCVDEAFVRLDASRGLIEESMTRVFLSSCLEAAPPDSALCRGVPPQSDIAASVGWALSTCAGLGRANNQPCTRLVSELQDYCHPD
jgi:hypothetical protein